MTAFHPSPELQILLAGRLHPATFVIQAAQTLRRSVLIIAVLAYQAARGELAARVATFSMLVLLFGMAAVGSLIYWVRYRWRLTDDALLLTSGILSRQDRRIPIARIQDLSVSAGPLHRLFGVVAVSVQTSSTQKSEAVLDAISRADAEALQAALEGARTRTMPWEPRAAEVAAPAEVLARVSTAMLVLRGLTDNRAGLVLAGVLAIVERAAEGGESTLRELFAGAREAALPWLGEGTMGVAALVVGGALAVLIVGYVVSAIVNVLAFHDFELSFSERDGGDGRREAVFIRRHGLLTLRRQVLPRRRIQAVRVRQTFARRLLGVATLQVDDMGSSADEESTKRTGADVFVPAARPEVLDTIVPRALVGLELAALPWRPVSSRMVRRSAARGALLGAAIAAPLVLRVGAAGLLVVPALGLALGLWGAAAHARLRYAYDGRFFAIRSGVLGRLAVYVPAGKVQAAVTTRTPLDRWHRVATVRVTVGGGASFHVANVPDAEADALIDALGRDEAGALAPALG
ncbi:MAG: PH domain-containing protein [Myxococcales bacterium]|nr:PH domain-containing protein [Myxococcales bacterium]